MPTSQSWSRSGRHVGGHGSEHSPHSTKGCTIFVKLRQFAPDDLDSVRIDTHTAIWPTEPVEGRRVLPLHVCGRERVSLERWQPGTAFPDHSHRGGEEIFVLEGVFEDECGRYPKGSWLRIPSGESHRSFSRDGRTIYVKSGHLPDRAQRR